jgi:hypothetical protein
MWKDRCLILLVLIAGLVGPSAALNIVLAGGTGEVARALVPRLVDHQVSLLARNAFLAAAPNRVTGEFGWVGASFLERHPHATLRDWGKCARSCAMSHNFTNLRTGRSLSFCIL